MMHGKDEMRKSYGVDDVGVDMIKKGGKGYKQVASKVV